MHTRLPVTVLSALLAVAAVPGSATAAAGEVGIWYDDTGKGAVEIVACGSSLCGNIFWLKEPTTPEGNPLVDFYNPTLSKRTRPICGLPILGDLQKQADGSWDSGWIYDPKQGASFDVALTLESADKLVVTGYKGIKLFSKTFVWTRASADLPRCDGNKGAATDKATPNAKQAKEGDGKTEKSNATAYEPTRDVEDQKATRSGKAPNGKKAASSSAAPRPVATAQPVERPRSVQRPPVQELRRSPVSSGSDVYYAPN